jgi:hypothetical protein
MVDVFDQWIRTLSIRRRQQAYKKSNQKKQTFHGSDMVAPSPEAPRWETARVANGAGSEDIAWLT